jgi:hypothetical protein
MVETQLHAAILRQDWARSMELALAEPHSVRERDSRGGLPLHCACICGAPLPLMRRLVEAYPEGLEAADKWDRTPLEVAVRNGKASGGTLQYLRSNPAPFLALAETRSWTELAAMQSESPAGWVAALAAERGAPTDVLDLLCEDLGPASLTDLIEARLWEQLAARAPHLITEEVCAAVDADGRFPVEVAIDAVAPEHVVGELTRLSPPPILTHAIAAGDWARAMELARANPSWVTIKERGRRGWLPAHAAASHGAPLALMRLLVEPAGGDGSPLAVLAAKDNNDRTPHEIATLRLARGAANKSQQQQQAVVAPVSPTRAGLPVHGRSEAQADAAAADEEGRQVLSYLQHYPALHEAAVQRRDWSAFTALLQQQQGGGGGGGGGGWVVSLAASHGAPSTVVDSLCDRLRLSLGELIAAEAWPSILRRQEQEQQQQQQQQQQKLITPAACRSQHIYSGQKQPEYPLQAAMRLGSAPMEVLELLRKASNDCQEALGAALHTAVAHQQWETLRQLNGLLASEAGLGMVEECTRLSRALAEEVAKREAEAAQKEAALSREKALLAKEREHQAELAELRRQLAAAS